MKRHHIKIVRGIPAIILALFVTLVSCNSKSSDEDEIVVNPSITAIKEFHLLENDSVLSDLDSVFFSIDLDRGLIFNADSLPKGTNISRLAVSITFVNSMQEANISFKKNNELDTVVNYLTNPGDSIDFTSPVTLDVTAADGESKFSYILKVNVHEQDPDTLIWDKMAVASLPSAGGAPRAQKTIKAGPRTATIIEEKDGAYTLAISDNLFGGIWNKQDVKFQFTPVIDSFNFSADCYYILSDKDELFSSANGIEWISTKETGWVSIIVPYLDTILGLKHGDKGLQYCHYPARNNIADGMMDPDFPVKGRSQAAEVVTEWSPWPMVFFAGGQTQSGELSGAVWAFDGTTWTTISSHYLPALEGASIARYVVYKETPQLFKQRELDVWLLIGGELADGVPNRTIYMSPDNGISWQEVPSTMQLPDYFPSIKYADAMVEHTQHSADLSDIWTPTAEMQAPKWYKVSYTIDGLEIYWECPYIYIFGGIMPDGMLSDSIWRGVLARLAFTPLI